ncbi:MAG: hypothetical protein J7K57_08140 [Palaeococcus sp.]|uniref:hypothetical protein n=1 Tax=Palaeococcus sp. (in: euryarchaeotes) TaxID=2820298 RepID=UPI0025D5B1C7|nr:hypothetical protein [Palaeococcus sp. (in: euryarchaeotes)]MCD6559817.1 hypothetical protein [Palaeococcus sp. (in: euryarchaeotes)]
MEWWNCALSLEGFTEMRVGNQTFTVEVEHVGLRELKLQALYKFAEENGVDMFFKYLSEYTRNTMKRVSYEDVKNLLIENSPVQDYVNWSEATYYPHSTPRGGG